MLYGIIIGLSLGYVGYIIMICKRVCNAITLKVRAFLNKRNENTEPTANELREMQGNLQQMNI